MATVWAALSTMFHQPIIYANTAATRAPDICIRKKRIYLILNLLRCTFYWLKKKIKLILLIFVSFYVLQKEHVGSWNISLVFLCVKSRVAVANRDMTPRKIPSLTTLQMQNTPMLNLAGESNKYKFQEQMLNYTVVPNGWINQPWTYYLQPLPHCDNSCWPLCCPENHIDFNYV